MLGKVAREDRKEDRTRQWLYIVGVVVWLIALAWAFSSGSGGGVILVLIVGIAAFLAFSKGEPAASSSRNIPRDEAGRLVLRRGSDKPVSEAERVAALDEEVATYAREGFSLRQRTATTAQLVKPKRFSFLWALVWFLMLGVGLVVYLLYYAAKRDEGRYVEVDEYGAVKATLQ